MNSFKRKSKFSCQAVRPQLGKHVLELLIDHGTSPGIVDSKTYELVLVEGCRLAPLAQIPKDFGRSATTS
jgi:hypothetical protein